MPISIITVNWNGAEVLPDYLRSLAGQTRPPHEALVVDNGSADASMALLDAAGVNVIRLPENRGFAAPNNLAADRATGDAVLLLNNDTQFDAGLVESLEAALEEHPDFDLFACSMRDWDNPELLENTGIGYRRTLSGYQLGRGDRADRWATALEVFGPSGGAALIRRRVIEDIGLFDEAFFAYNEDVDFALRARLAGYRCLYLPGATVRHREGATAKRLGARKMWLIQRNAEWAMRRNIPVRLQRRYALFHWAYIAQQTARNGPAALWARMDAIRHPRPCGGEPRVTDAEFLRWLS
ncbi:MAG TPA: glycosyltransferase family 2 protein [Armatimonadota bacterium]